MTTLCLISTYFLALDTTIAAAIAGVLGLVIGLVVTVVMMKLSGSRIIEQANSEKERIIADAKRESETLAKQLELDAKTALVAKQEAFEEKTSSIREEQKNQEITLNKRESDLDRKYEALGMKEKDLNKRETKLTVREDEMEKDRRVLDVQLNEAKEKLLKMTEMTVEEARQMLLQQVERECKHEAAQIVQREIMHAKEESKAQSQEIVINAIQRFAAEHTVSSTVTSITLPSDDMKGRVIGREGRNIRSFEKITGVDVIVDDTPGVVVVSCFDPVRRAVAAETMAILLEDGRIHPTRIEEVFNETERVIEERIVQYGKDACVEANIQGLHPRIVDAMGRLHFRTSYGQNILRHSVEVAFISQLIADQLGLDGTIARRAGFLHDIGKAMDHDTEGGHPAIGCSYVRKYGEKREEVLNAIAGHHFDIETTTPYTVIVAAADAISGARPGARRETLEKYIKRLEQLEEIAMVQEGVKQAYAIQAGREVRVIVDSKNVDDAGAASVARDIAKKIEEEMTYPGEVRVTVLREVRKTEYAR